MSQPQYPAAALAQIENNYGAGFYLLDSQKFLSNLLKFKTIFGEKYPKFALAYSYKTNYIPKLCALVNKAGGYAEIVSTMELDLALKVGVWPEKIIWNGPYKPAAALAGFLWQGGLVNIDNLPEAELICNIAAQKPERTIAVGIRCNFDIGDKNISRFGVDTAAEEFPLIISKLQKVPNIQLVGLHCHFSPRNFKTWQARVSGMLATIKTLNFVPRRLDFGGSLFGEPDPATRAQYKAEIPSWEDYAKAITTPLKRYFSPESEMPELLLEPGSALVGNCLDFVAKVLNIKQIRGKAIATVLGSSYNLTQSLSRKNPPLAVVPMGGRQASYADLDIGAFTCIDFDYLYRHFNGRLAIGDFIVFRDVGAYSLVLRPPFILPDFPVLEFTAAGVQLVRRGGSFADIFSGYAPDDDSFASNRFEADSLDSNATNGYND